MKRSILLLLLIATPLIAQDASQRNDCERLFAEAAEGHRKQRETNEHQASPLGAGTVGPIATTAVALVAGEADGRGVISYIYPLENAPHPLTGAVFTAKASAPFTKETGESVLATLDELTGDLVLNAGLTKRWWDLDITGYASTLCAACEEGGKTLLQCNDTILPGTQAVDRLFGRLAAKSFGAEVSAGRKKREYFTAEGVAENESGIGIGASIYGGLLFRGSSAYLRLTAKQDFKENAAVQKCEPAGTGLSTCKSLPLLEAKRIDTISLATEARYFFKHAAIAPSISYEFQEGDTTLLLPIFLVRSEDASGFTGGIRLGWTTVKDAGFVAGLFITKPLKP
jgi:hypothetical protein